MQETGKYSRTPPAPGIVVFVPPAPGIFVHMYRQRPGFFCLLRLRGCLFRRPSGDIFLESCENPYICDDKSICLDTFRHTFFAHLSLLLLWVIFLQADAFAELGGARSSAAGNPAPESRAASRLEPTAKMYRPVAV